MYNKYRNKILRATISKERRDPMSAIKPSSPSLEQTFLSPPVQFRGVPFWAWNCKVTEDKIERQAAYFRQMGMGGAMVHPRTGMDTPYLSEEYLRLVQYAEEKLRENGLSCWLYDEERFPSGVAGGIVTRNIKYRARYIVLSDHELSGYCESKTAFDKKVDAREKPKGYFLCDYRVHLENGFLSSYEMLPSGGNYHAYVELMEESPWFNGETYVDVFNPQAIDEFLHVTHEQYCETLKDHIGKTVPAIFTDEPHMKGKHCMPTPQAGRATLAYTDDMNDTFREAYGTELLSILPELVWELPGAYSVWRYRYHEHVTERFAAAYGDRIGAWCEKHGIAYTGHFLSERTLFSQTLALGETMRQYRSQQLPGIDILAGQLELTTAKQADSVRRQMGRTGLVCEMYGVLEWDVTFRQHKLQGDWLTALGVTVRVHHLAFMGMGGEAKRDWPAAIGWQSPWWRQYSYLEDYFARVNVMLRRGVPVTRVAIVHPIESFWLLFGPNDQTLMRREQMDEQFEHLAQWLLYGGIDYDYLSEALLPSLCTKGGCPLRVGKCRYEAVIVPPVLTMRKTTLERLAAFAKAGGKLIFLGSAPALIDGEPSAEAFPLWEAGIHLPMERAALLNALRDQRDIEVRSQATGRLSDNLFYQLRQEGEERILFLCHVREETPARPRVYTIRLKGLWRILRMNALDGSIEEMGGAQENGFTEITWPCHAQDSLLLRLIPGACAAPAPLPQAPRPFLKLSETADFTLEEPNALLLDRCEYALDEGPWQSAEDILRADNSLREKAGLPPRNGNSVQPWLLEDDPPRHTAHLKFRFYAEKQFSGLKLAMEQPEKAEITLNGEKLTAQPDGWYVDEAIQTIPLPEIKVGENEITLRLPLTRRANLEALYILGAFGVRIAGTHLTLTEPPQRLFLDDLTRQGLPFYTGNVRYRFQIHLGRARNDLHLHIPHMASPVAVVYADGQEAGQIAWQPNRVKLPPLNAGEHEIEILACGSRFNGFGTLHNANPHYMWYGPDAFRTVGDDWTDNYLTRPSYLLSPIELMEDPT